MTDPFAHLRTDRPVTDEQKKLKVGDDVICTKDDGSEHICKVRMCPPFKAPNGTWVVFVTGITGYYVLCRVRKITSNPHQKFNVETNEK